MGFRFRTELESINSVIRKLNEDQSACFIFFKGLDGQTEKMIKLAQETGIPHRVLDSTLDAKTEETLLAGRREFERALNTSIPLGLDGWHFAEKKIREYLAFDNTAIVLRHYELAKRLFDTEAPDVLIVLGDHTLLDWLLCLAAKSKGIKIVAIPTYFD